MIRCATISSNHMPHQCARMLSAVPTIPTGSTRRAWIHHPTSHPSRSPSWNYPTSAAAPPGRGSPGPCRACPCGSGSASVPRSRRALERRGAVWAGCGDAGGDAQQRDGCGGGAQGVLEGGGGGGRGRPAPCAGQGRSIPQCIVQAAPRVRVLICARCCAHCVCVAC